MTIDTARCETCGHTKFYHAGPDWSNSQGCCEDGCECRKFVGPDCTEPAPSAGVSEKRLEEIEAMLDEFLAAYCDLPTALNAHLPTASAKRNRFTAARDAVVSRLSEAWNRRQPQSRDSGKRHRMASPPAPLRAGVNMSDIPKLVAELSRIRLHGGNFDEANRDSKVIADAVQALEQMADIREAAMQDCWNAVDDLIVEGHLVEPWRNEQRNGFVLATNAITALIDKERSVRKAEGMTIPYTDAQGKRDE